MSLTGLSANPTTRVVTIQGKEYIYKMLSGLVALDVGTKLLEIFGPTIGSAIDGVQRAEYIMPDETTFWSELMIHLSRSLHGVKMSDIAVEVLPEVWVNSSTRLDINTLTITQLKALLLDALKENFGDLFLELLQARGLEIHTWEDLKKMTMPEQNKEVLQTESTETPQ